MFTNKVNSTTKIMVVSTFLIMIIVNALANIIPLNGVNTGQVSDSYPNLFAPTGITFSIWGLIYLLLTVYTLYHIGLLQRKGNDINTRLLDRVGKIFYISSLANSAWIFSWHYGIIQLSMLLMIILLVCLILINKITNDEKLTIGEKIFIKLPFSVYFGWITVATIANATALLVSLGWDGSGISDQIWTVIVLNVGMIIGIITMINNQDIAYGAVLIWAYAGIWFKHTSPSGFAGQYPLVIYTSIACIVIFLACEAYVLFSKKSRSMHQKLSR